MDNLQKWSERYYFQLAVFNVLLIFAFLLRSAGYFHPFFTISVNFIVVLGLLAAIPLFGARSRAMFVVALVFWFFASFLRIVQIEVWAERTTVYAYQALVIGVVLMVVESLGFTRRK